MQSYGRIHSETSRTVRTLLIDENFLYISSGMGWRFDGLKEDTHGKDGIDIEKVLL